MNACRLSMAIVGVILFAASTSRSEPLGIGASMPATDSKMTGVDDKAVTLADVKGKAGTLVVFSCNHCPYVKAWQDRMVQVANDAVKKGIGVVFVNSNDPVAFPEDDLAHMKELAGSKGYAFPYVVDETSAVAVAFGATKTPEAFLFDGADRLVYHGTIDDNTHDASKVKKTHLKNAVDALLAGKAIAESETKSVGCGIKFRKPAAK